MNFLTKRKNNSHSLANLIVKITSIYKNKEELSVLKKSTVIEKNAKMLFLNNTLMMIPVIWSAYAILGTIISKKSEIYNQFEISIALLSIMTLIIYLLSLYTQCLLKNIDNKILAIDYVLENYNKFY